MLQLAPRFTALLALCFLASATPVIHPLDPFVSLSAGVGQPTPYLHDVARDVPVPVLVNLLNDSDEQQKPTSSAAAQANHTARALPVSAPVDLLEDGHQPANSTARAIPVPMPVDLLEDGHEPTNHTARAVPISVFADILKDGHEPQPNNNIPQANRTARAVPISVPADTLSGGHYMSGVQDDIAMGKDTQATPGQGSSGQQPHSETGPDQGKGKRDDGQYHPSPTSGTHSFDDGQYHPNPAYDNGQYHPNSAYDDGRYHASSTISDTVTPTANPTNPITDPDLVSSGVQAVPSVVGVATSALLNTITVTVTSTGTAVPAFTSSSAPVTTTVSTATPTAPTPAAATTPAAVTDTPTDAIADILDAVNVDKRYEDGQYHPDPKFNDGLYHLDPKFDDGQYHPRRYDERHGLVYQGKVRAVRRRASRH